RSLRRERRTGARRTRQTLPSFWHRCNRGQHRRFLRRSVDRLLPTASRRARQEGDSMSRRGLVRRGSLGALAAALLAVLLVATAAAQTAAPPKVTVELDKSRVTVGDPIQLVVTIEYAPDVTITTSGIDAQLAPFE